MPNVRISELPVAGAVTAEDLFVVVDGGTTTKRGNADQILDFVQTNTALDDLNNVAVPSPSTNDVLTWNGSAWVPAAPSSGTLDSLTDVNTSGQATNDLLTLSGSTWVPVGRNNLLSLDQLSDVNLAGATNGDVLTRSAGSWISSPPSGGTLELDDLTDVDTTGVSTGDFLMYSSGTWVDRTLLFDDISDVNLSGASNGDFLQRQSGVWVDRTLVFDDISDVDLTGATNGDFLQRQSGVWVDRTLVISDAADVNTSGVSDGDVLTYDSGTTNWVPQAPAGGTNALDDLTDVTITTPSDGQVLTYDSGSTSWINAAPTGGGGNFASLKEIAVDEATISYPSFQTIPSATDNLPSSGPVCVLTTDPAVGDWVHLTGQMHFDSLSSYCYAYLVTTVGGVLENYVLSNGLNQFKSSGTGDSAGWITFDSWYELTADDIDANTVTFQIATTSDGAHWWDTAWIWAANHGQVGGGIALVGWNSGDTYGAGQLVDYSGLIMTPRTSTSADPFSLVDVAAGDVDNTSYWTHNSVASASGGEVVLINASAGDSATVILTTGDGVSTFPTTTLTAELYLGGSADELQFGLLNESTSSSSITSDGMRGVTGFYGVMLDVFNNEAKIVTNGSSGSAVSVDPDTGGVYETWSLEFGADYMKLYRAAGATLVGNWSFTPPAWSGSKVAFGARTGGASGTFKVRNTPTVNQQSADWRRLFFALDAS